MTAEQFPLDYIFLKNRNAKQSMTQFLRERIARKKEDLYNIVFPKEIIIFPDGQIYFHDSRNLISLNNAYKKVKPIHEIIAMRILGTLEPWIIEELNNEN